MDIRLPTENRVAFKAVSRRFGHVHALEAFDLVVRTRELVVILGSPGAGKSTALRIGAGLESVSAGTVHIDGLDVTLLPGRRRNVGFVFQTPALFPHLSVEDNIALPLRAQRVSVNARVRRVDELIDSFHIEHLRKLSPRRLKEDERHIVALARAMVRDPLAFLMDEPLGTLSGELRRDTRERVRRIHTSLRTTTIYATDNAEDAFAVADRIAVLDAGKLIQCGTADELRHRPASEIVKRFVAASRPAVANNARSTVAMSIDSERAVRK